uniref:BEAN1 protein n=1 Tax=Serinus canaria TaxID=9135 RepID=A0A8C9NA23_SERCA
VRKNNMHPKARLFHTSFSYFPVGFSFPSAGEHGGDSSLLVSPLLVAGVVIGLVLLLSCATIVVGSLRRDSRARRPRPGTAAADGEGPRDTGGRAANVNCCFAAPDGFSHGGSSAELRSTCSEELPPACDFDSYLDILSQVNLMYPDPPPCYDECVGPGATQIYIPTDDPPPYSLTDPCQRNETARNICTSQEEERCPEVPQSGLLPGKWDWLPGLALPAAPAGLLLPGTGPGSGTCSPRTGESNEPTGEGKGDFSP